MQYSIWITVKKSAYSFLKTTAAVGIIGISMYYADGTHTPVWAAPVSGLFTAAFTGLGNWAKHNLLAD